MHKENQGVTYQYFEGTVKFWDLGTKKARGQFEVEGKEVKEVNNQISARFFEHLTDKTDTQDKIYFDFNKVIVGSEIVGSYLVWGRIFKPIREDVYTPADEQKTLTDFKKEKEFVRGKTNRCEVCNGWLYENAELTKAFCHNCKRYFDLENG